MTGGLPAPRRRRTERAGALQQDAQPPLKIGIVSPYGYPHPGGVNEHVRHSYEAMRRKGHDAWIIGNDTEQGRHALAVSISDDEGRTWKWKRHLENEPPGPNAGAYHYPSVIEARDGWIHATYSHHTSEVDQPRDARGWTSTRSIKHVRFNEAWVQVGDPSR